MGKRIKVWGWQDPTQVIAQEMAGRAKSNQQGGTMIQEVRHQLGHWFVNGDGIVVGLTEDDKEYRRAIQPELGGDVWDAFPEMVNRENVDALYWEVYMGALFAQEQYRYEHGGLWMWQVEQLEAEDIKRGNPYY